MLQYKVIEIFTSEEELWRGKRLHSAIVQSVSDMKIAARSIVTRGIEGSYENGEITAGKLESLSYKVPVRITIIVPAVEFESLLVKIDEMVTDGIIAIRDAEVISHKMREALMPRNTKVRDIMTRNPRRVSKATPVSDVAKLLLSSTFTGLPVVDDENRPIGVIAQGDLIYKAELPMRIGLLAQADKKKIEAILDTLTHKKAMEIMTQPAVTIEHDRLITEAVELMLKKKVKRLPVVNDEGKLVGIISRVDIFRTTMAVCPDWGAFQGKGIRVEGLRYVADIMRRDSYTVLPDTPVHEVMRIIDCNDIQRICVVDEEGYFKGLISDRDLLVAFSERHPGVWDYFVGKIPFTERGKRNRELSSHLRAKTASEVMKTQVVTVREDTSIEETITSMLETAYKRLLVLDPEGKFKGMISRDSLLRTIFAL